MTILLDSTILIDALRNRNQSRSLLEGLLHGGNILATSSINVGEVFAGLRPGEETQTEAFLSGVDCYPVTAGLARRAGLLVSEWRRRGRTFTLNDMIIAATALEHDLTLMTANRRDFPMPELKFYPA